MNELISNAAADQGFSPFTVSRRDDDNLRLKILRVTNTLLAALFSLDGSKRLKIDGMPADARIVGVSDQIYFDRNETAFKVWSSTFPIVPQLSAIPELHLAITEAQLVAGMPTLTPELLRDDFAVQCSMRLTVANPNDHDPGQPTIAG